MVNYNEISKAEMLVLFNLSQSWLAHLSDELLDYKKETEDLKLRLLDVEHRLEKLDKRATNTFSASIISSPHMSPVVGIPDGRETLLENEYTV